MTSDEKRIIDSEFDKAYELYRESIFNFCMSRLACNIDESEDCTQEVFVVYYNRLKKGEHFESPRPFLYKSAVNIIKRHLSKKAKRDKNEVLMEDDMHLPDKMETVEANINYELLQKRIDEILSNSEKEIYSMYFVSGIRVQDIALELGIKPQACATRIFRIRNKIKEGVKEFI